jgi:hypothetical protein
LVCVCVFFCVCVVLCVGTGLATSWSPVRGVLLSVKWSRNWEISPLLQSGIKRREKISKKHFSKAGNCSAGQEISIHGSGKSITVPIEGRHDTVSRTSGINLTSSHTICLSSILILFSHLCLDIPNGHIHSGFPEKMRTQFSFSLMCYIPSPYHLRWFLLV